MNITAERLLEIEVERNQTMSDPAFQAWARELEVGIRYTSPESKLNAREMMSKWTGKNGELNSFTVLLGKSN